MITFCMTNKFVLIYICDNTDGQIKILRLLRKIHKYFFLIKIFISQSVT